LSDAAATTEAQDDADHFVSVFCDVLKHDMDEDVILARMDKHFDPIPAVLFSNEDEQKALQKSVDQFSRRFDCNYSSSIFILPFDANPATGKIKIKTYHISLLNEWFSYFHKCRRSVCRAHMYCITLGALDKHPHFWPDMSEEMRAVAKNLMESRVWDALEIATARLASYWDRVGQILDFVFFNIKQYERDGFPLVLERIKRNFAMSCPDIYNSHAWHEMNKYANSEKQNGYKWLIRRRNLVVHSMQMKPRPTYDNDVIFEYEFDHFEDRIVRDLAIKELREELLDIHSHLTSAASLVPFVIELATLGLDALDREITSRHR
jgi:hypothetical protein